MQEGILAGNRNSSALGRCDQYMDLPWRIVEGDVYVGLSVGVKHGEGSRQTRSERGSV